jgi:hypothetical protein
MIIDFLVFLAVGRLVIWSISVAKPTQRFWMLFDECDFCLGMWVFFVLAGFFSLATPTFLAAWTFPLPYTPVLSQFLIALFASFVMHVFRIGWTTRFSNAV